VSYDEPDGHTLAVALFAAFPGPPPAEATVAFYAHQLDQLEDSAAARKAVNAAIRHGDRVPSWGSLLRAYEAEARSREAFARQMETVGQLPSGERPALPAEAAPVGEADPERVASLAAKATPASLADVGPVGTCDDCTKERPLRPHHYLRLCKECRARRTGVKAELGRPRVADAFVWQDTTEWPNTGPQAPNGDAGEGRQEGERP
jgi:hypothetical protein